MKQETTVNAVEQSEKKPRWKERYTAKYPNANFDDDNAMKTAFYEDYDNSNNQLNTFKEDNNKLIEIVRENPELSVLIKELMQGAPMRVALVKANIDLPTPEDGDADFADYESEVKKRNSQKAEAEKRTKEYNDNIVNSQKEIETFFKTKNLSESEENEFTEFVDNSVAEMLNGIFTQKSLSKLYQAFKYEEDVANAKTAGVIDGRNANIETKREKKVTQTDGLASSASGTITTPQRKGGYIDNLLNNNK